MFNPGDRVYVDDSALKALRDIFEKYESSDAPPNHHGTVDEDQEGYEDSGMVIITFDDGGAAPYPYADVHLLNSGL